MNVEYKKIIYILIIMLIFSVVSSSDEDPWRSISKRAIPDGGPPLSEFYDPPTSISAEMMFTPTDEEPSSEVRDGFRVVSTVEGPDNKGFIVPRASREHQLAYLRGMAEMIIPRLQYYSTLAQKENDFERAEMIRNDIDIAREMLDAAQEGDEDKLNVLAQQCSPIILGLVDTIKSMPARKSANSDIYTFQTPRNWYEDNGKGLPRIAIVDSPLDDGKSGGAEPTDSSELLYRSPTCVYLQIVRHEDDCGDQVWTETDVVYTISIAGNYFTTGKLSQDDNDFDCDVELAVNSSASSATITLEAWDTDGGWTGDDQMDLRWGSGYIPSISYNFSTKLWSGDASVPYTVGDDGDDWAKCWFSITSSYDDDVGQRDISWHYWAENKRSGCLWGGTASSSAPVMQNNASYHYQDLQEYTNQYYKFYVQNGDYFCVSTDPFAGGGITEENIDLYLYDPDNIQRVSSTNGGGSADQVCITADKSGWWYVRTYAAGGYQSWFDIWFSNQLTNDYNVVTATITNERGYLIYSYSNGSHTCYYYEDTEDWYKFYMPASSGRILTVNMTPQSGSRDYDLVVYFPDGSYLGGSYNWGDATETVSDQADPGGWYYFRVYRYSGDPGYYTFSVDTALMNLSGTFTSQNITPPASGCEYQWTEVEYQQTLNSGTVVMEILDGAGSPVPGYTYSSVSDGTIIWNLSGLNTEHYPSLRLKASLYGSGGNRPYLHNWAIKWAEYGTGSQAIWIGGVSTAWSDANNWYCNTPPDASKDVIISTVYIDTYMPTVNINTATCRDISIGSATILTISGTNALTCRTVTIEDGGKIDVTGTGSMDVSGNWNNNGTFVAGNGTVTFTGSATKNIQGANSTAFYNLSTSGGTTQLQLTSYVDNNFTNSATFSQLGNTFYVRGNFTNNGSFQSGTGGIIYFDGATDQTISGTNQPVFYYLYLNKSGSTLILNRNITVQNLEDFSRPGSSVMRLNGNKVSYGP